MAGSSWSFNTSAMVVRISFSQSSFEPCQDGAVTLVDMFPRTRIQTSRVWGRVHIPSGPGGGGSTLEFPLDESLAAGGRIWVINACAGTEPVSDWACQWLSLSVTEPVSDWGRFRLYFRDVHVYKSFCSCIMYLKSTQLLFTNSFRISSLGTRQECRSELLPNVPLTFPAALVQNVQKTSQWASGRF